MITRIEPQVQADGRYTVSQTCTVLGIHRKTLSKYTEAGLIKCGYRRETARKFYKGSEIVRFWRAQM